ncbi:MAG: hypothetical protein V9F82_03665 [Dermatophilaceae bacterium]
MIAAGVLWWRLLRWGRRAAYLHLTPAALCTADLRIPWSEVRAFPVRVAGRPDNTEGIGVVVGDLENVVGFARARVALANWRGRPLRLADIDQLPAAHSSVLRALSLLAAIPRPGRCWIAPTGSRCSGRPEALSVAGRAGVPAASP